MMKHAVAVLCATAVAGALAACSGTVPGVSATSEAGTATATTGTTSTSGLQPASLPGPVYSDASQAITVEVGGYFTLSLRVVKRLGVSWFVSYDKSALMMVINDLYVDDNPSSPGLGGTEYYRFQALKAGNTRVDCALEHGPTGPVSERRTFNVRVK